MAFQTDYHTVDAQQTILDAMTFLVDADNNATDQSFKFYADDPSTGTLILQARYDETSTTAELTSGAAVTTVGTSGNRWTTVYATTVDAVTLTLSGDVAAVNGVFTGYIRGGSSTTASAAGDASFGDGTDFFSFDQSTGLLLHAFSNDNNATTIRSSTYAFNVSNYDSTNNNYALIRLDIGNGATTDGVYIQGKRIGNNNTDLLFGEYDNSGSNNGTAYVTINGNGEGSVSISGGSIPALSVGAPGHTLAANDLAVGSSTSSNLVYDDSLLTLSQSGTGAAVFNRLSAVAGTATVFNEQGADVDFRIEVPNSTHAVVVDAGNNRIVFNDTGGDVDVRIETSGEDFAFFTDAANNRLLMVVPVRIGISTAAVAIGDASIGSTGTYWFLDESADQITFQTDSAGALGPVYRFYHNSASPAASDVYARLQFDGESSTGATVTYSQFDMVIDDATNGSEDAHWSVYLMVAGALGECFRVGGNTVSLGGVSGSYVQYNKVTDTLLFEGDPTGATGITWRTYTNSATPAAADFVFTAQHDGENSTGGIVTYGEYRVQISNPALGVEDSLWQFDTLSGGVTTTASLSVIGVWTDASLDANKIYEANWTWGTDAEDTATAREIIRQLQNGVFTGTGLTSCHYIGPTAEHWHKLTGLDDGLGIAPKNLAGLALMAAVELDTRVEDIGLQLSLHAGRLDAAEQKILALEARVAELEGAA